MLRTVIKSTGRYLPPRVVSNLDLCGMMDTSEEWIRQRTGIETRRWVPPEGGVGSSDLGLAAARIALERAGWTPRDLDLIIFATLSPDIFFPGPGCLIQHKLGLDRTPALDIRQQCTGFLYGLTTADAYIRSGHARRVLLVCAEVHSTGLDISTRGRDVTVIFGDGAAALCIEGVETDRPVGVLASALHANGGLAASLMTEACTSLCSPRISHEMLDQGRQYPKMEGKLIFKEAVTKLPEVTHEALAIAGMKLADVDLFIPHQANLRINQFFQESMKLAPEKVFHNIQRYGNTTAASIPIALDEAIEMQRVGEGGTVMFLALGAGLTWGAVLCRLGS
jgi:3-oxoacyl-[acyl-carrier-protein] synthase-3